MDPVDHPVLTEIAELVADGEVVDWDDLSARHPHLAQSIKSLQLLSALSDTCQSAATGDADPVVAPPEIWGPLRIIEKIGEGSFGEVFRAYDKQLQREVALKLRRPQNEGKIASYVRHLEEARRMARVRHPHVLAIYGVETFEGRPGMWTDFIEGMTLEDALIESGPMSAEDLTRIGIDLSSALHAVHGVGLVHGDIKTSNVMRENTGRIILMDFGAGREAHSGEGDSKAAAEGTPIAMAPEVLDGGPPSVASDLYSLGVLLYRIASGRNPIEADDFLELIAKVGRVTPVPLHEVRPGLPPSFAGLVERLLQTEPGDRPTTAAAVRAELTIASGSNLTGVGNERAVPNNLPTASGRFIGRREELLSAVRTLSASRLATVIGPAGAGKTRLALEAAWQALDQFRDGAWWIDLSAVADPQALEGEVARVLEVRGVGAQRPIEAIIKQLKESDRLLVLDNAEHLLDATRELIESLLERCDGVHILCTSRTSLGSDVESVLSLGSMSYPEGDSSPSEAVEYESIRLFVERAHASRPGFALSEDNCPTISRICRQLEGIPLAVELAAARVRSIGLDDIAARLEQNLRLIMGQRDPEQESHHKTLRASLEWSYDLLSAREQRLLATLSVFRGGWTLESAEAICIEPDEVEEMVDMLSELVERSLVVFESASTLGRTDRYRVLEMVRTFAAEKFEAGVESAETRQRHLRHFRLLAEEADKELQGPRQAKWFDRLRADNENFERALDLAAPDVAQTEDAMRMAASLSRYWAREGLVAHGARRAEEILDRPSGRAPTPYRAALMTWMGNLKEALGDYHGSIAAHEENRKISEDSGERRGVAVAYSNLSDCNLALGNYDLAMEQVKNSLRIMEDLEDDVGTALCLNALGRLEQSLGRPEVALETYQRGLEIQRRRKDPLGVALLAHNVASSMLQVGNRDGAERLAREALELRESVGFQLGVASSLNLLGGIEFERGNDEEAEKLFDRSLRLRHEIGFTPGVIHLLEQFAILANRRQQFERAAVLLGAAERHREELEDAAAVNAAQNVENQIATARAGLGDERTKRVFERGRFLDLDAAVGYALGD